MQRHPLFCPLCDSAASASLEMRAWLGGIYTSGQFLPPGIAVCWRNSDNKARPVLFRCSNLQRALGSGLGDKLSDSKIQRKGRVEHVQWSILTLLQSYQAL